MAEQPAIAHIQHFLQGGDVAVFKTPLQLAHFFNEIGVHFFVRLGHAVMRCFQHFFFFAKVENGVVNQILQLFFGGFIVG